MRECNQMANGPQSRDVFRSWTSKDGHIADTYWRKFGEADHHSVHTARMCLVKISLKELATKKFGPVFA